MTPHPKLLSVIIPTYNRNKLLDHTLFSLKCQSLDSSLIEIIIVDDGSTEDTLSVVNLYRDYFSIRYFYQEDKGYRVASARNIGIRNASGQVLVFIDSGIIVGSKCLESHLQSHLISSYSVAVIGYILGLEVEDQKIGGLIQKIDISDPDKTIADLLLSEIYLDIREDVFRICGSIIGELPAPWALFWTGNVSVRRNVIIDAGLFDTDFDLNWGMEDIDLGYRLFNNGVKFLLNKNASSIHYPHLNDEKKKLVEEQNNKKLFHSKYNSVESKALLKYNPVSLNLYLAMQKCIQ